MSAAGTTILYVTQTISGCQSPATPVSVVVNAPIDIVTTTTFTICTGTSANLGTDLVVSGGDGIYTYSWKQGSVEFETTSTATVSPTANSTYTLEVTDGNGCSSSELIQVIVEPRPAAPVVQNPIAVCEGDAIPQVTTTSSGTITWYADAGLTTVIGTGTSFTPSSTEVDNTTAGTYSIYATSTTGTQSCEGPATEVIYTINPAIALDFGGPYVICSGESVTLGDSPIATGGSGSFTYQWSLAAVPFSVQSNPVVSPMTTTTYELTVTDANGCQTSGTVLVEVNESPIADAGPDSEECDLIHVLSAQPSVGGSIGSWTQISGPGLSFFSNNNSPTATVTVDTYGTYVFEWTEDNNSCTDSDQVSVWFNPQPVANAGTGGDVCGLGFLFSGLPSVSGSTGMWSQVSGPGTSSFNNASSPNATVTVTDFGTYEFSWTEQIGSCVDLALITVNFFEQPIAEAGTASEECSLIHSMDAAFSVTGSTGTWSILSGPGTASYDDLNDPLAQVTVSAYGTYIFQWEENNNGCIDTDQVTIRFTEPAGIVSVINDGATFCEPASVALSGIIEGGATNGNWSLVSGGSGTLSASSLIGNQVSATYFPAPGEFGLLEFELITNDPDGAGPCVPATRLITMTIEEAPQVTAGPDAAVCEDAGNIVLQGAFSGSATDVLWTGGLGTFDDPTDPTATYTFDPLEIGTTVILTLTAQDPDGAGPCTEAVDQVSITINPLPVVNFFNLPNITDEGAAPVVLVGNRRGGTFTISPGSGLGTTYIEDNQDKVLFDPAAATVSATNYVTYTYTDPNGCSNSITQSVLVNELTSIDFTIQGAITDAMDRLQICSGAGNVPLIGFPGAATGFPVTEFTSPTAGLISNPSANVWLFNTNVAPGLYEVRYSFTNEFNATSNIIRQVKVVATPVADFQNLNACAEDAIEFEDISTLNAGPFPTQIVSWNWNFGDSEAVPAVSSAGPLTSTIYPPDGGSKNISMTVTTDFGCSNTVNRTIVLGEKPKPDFTWENICQTDNTVFSADTTDIATYSWNFGDQGIMGTGEMPTHQFSGPGYYNVELSVMSDSGCPGDTVKQVFILPYVDVDVTPNNEYFQDFNTSDGNWVPEALTNNGPVSWVYNTPAGQVLNSDNPAWYTGANGGTYFESEQSYLNGPCFNLDALERPMIAMDLHYSTQEEFDGAVLQYSLDGGDSWMNVGERNGGVNWFNGQGIISRPGDDPGNYNEGDQGWTGVSENIWMSARYSLDEITGSNKIRFRLAFSSDGTNPNSPILEGIGIDNIFIGEKKRNVLVEFFADNGLEASNGFNTSLNGLLDDPDVSEFNSIQYHLNQSGIDTFHEENSSDPLARGLFYSVSSAPRFVLDGQVLPTSLDGNLSALKIDQRSLIDPLFTIDIDTLPSAQGVLSLNIRVEALTDVNQPVVLHAALSETRSSQSGNEYRDILKKLFYGGAGLDIPDVWTTGQVENYEINYVIDVEIQETEKLELFAFIQNKVDQSVYQSVRMKAPIRDDNALVTGVDDDLKDENIHISLYPNPVNGILNFYIPDRTNGAWSYTLIDQRGVTLLSGGMDFEQDRFSVETWNLSNGVYYVIIQRNDVPVTQRKVVVMNRVNR
jgi:hypothetical protein